MQHTNKQYEFIMEQSSSSHIFENGYKEENWNVRHFLRSEIFTKALRAWEV